MLTSNVAKGQVTPRIMWQNFDQIQLAVGNSINVASMTVPNNVEYKDLTFKQTITAQQLKISFGIV